MFEKVLLRILHRGKGKTRLMMMVYFVQFSLLVIVHAISVYGGKNVVLFIFDDLRPALGCYGDANAVTPNIDAVAEESIVFQRAYAQQALCAPSRNSFLTSRRPDTLHLYDLHSYWRATVGNFTTLPQYFRENGYKTKSVGKVFHPGVASNYSDDSPYSWSETPFHPSTLMYKNAEVCYSPKSPFVSRENIVCPVQLKIQPGGTLPDVEIAEEAVRFVRSLNSSEPFLLAVGFNKPHIPLKYPRHYNDYHNLPSIKLPPHRTKPKSLPNIAWNPWSDLRRRDDIAKLQLPFPFGHIPDNTSKRIIRSYYAAVTYVDALMGDVIKALKASGKYEDTVIAILGDHGWSLGEHGEWSKFSNYEVATRVPLIIRPPRTSTNAIHPQIKSEPVELLDLFPTVVHLAELPEVEKCDGVRKELCTEGKNLLLSNDTREAFSQYPRPSEYPQENSDEPKLKDIRFMGYSVRNDRFRYTEWVKFANFTPQWNSVVAAELYDHKEDPDEVANVAESVNYRRIREYLKTRLHEQGNISRGS